MNQWRFLAINSAYFEKYSFTLQHDDSQKTRIFMSNGRYAYLLNDLQKNQQKNCSKTIIN